MLRTTCAVAPEARDAELQTRHRPRRRQADHHRCRPAAFKSPTTRSSRSSKATAPAPTSGRPRVRVFDAAVAKAYGGKRRIAWIEIYAGEKANDVYGQDTWLPDETLEAIREYQRRHQGPADHAGRRRHPLAQRRAAPGPRPLRLRPAGALLHRRAVAGQAAREARHRDLPREHRGRLRGHRVARRARPRPTKLIEFLDAQDREDDPPRLRHRHQADVERSAAKRLVRRAIELRHRQQAASR